MLACTNQQIITMGWMFPPIVLLATVLMTAVACLFNNMLRQYPVFWWSPGEVGQKLSSVKRRKIDAERKAESDADVEALEKVGSTDGESHCGKSSHADTDRKEEAEQVKITTARIDLPTYLQLTQEEMEALESIRRKLHDS